MIESRRSFQDVKDWDQNLYCSQGLNDKVARGPQSRCIAARMLLWNIYTEFRFLQDRLARFSRVQQLNLQGSQLSK